MSKFINVIENSKKQKVLQLFERGVVEDENLPKFKKMIDEFTKEITDNGPETGEKRQNVKRRISFEDSDNMTSEDFNDNNFVHYDSSTFRINTTSNIVSNNSSLPQIPNVVIINGSQTEQASKKDNWFKKIRNVLFKSKQENKQDLTKVNLINPVEEKKKPNLCRFTLPHPSEVFALIVRNDEELKFVQGKVEKLRLMMDDAKSNGQIALAERIKKDAYIVLTEDQLVENKFNKIVSEERMIEFVENYQKELSLTYIKNYVRLIPRDVCDKKKSIDELCIFDNYVVLHFDPNAESEAMTQEEVKEEIARRKDPILFGLIRGSRKFYFIGDWKDEYCDLTFDKFVEKYSEELLTLKEQLV